MGVHDLGVNIIQLILLTFGESIMEWVTRFINRVVASNPSVASIVCGNL